jgi:hypothetical protein
MSIERCGSSGATLKMLSNKAALEAINPLDRWKGLKSEAHDFRLGTMTHTVAMSISDNVSRSFAPMNLWGTLAQYVLPDFGVACIPTADTAYFAPVLPISREAQVTFDATAYTDFQMSSTAVRPLAGMAILRSASLGTYPDGSGASRSCIGGAYAPREGLDLAYPDGMWQYLRAPSWLEAVAYVDDPSGQSPPALDRYLSDISADAFGSQTTVPTLRNDQLSWNQAYVDYAQMRYAENLYRGREGTFVGPLNLEVVPGITIRLTSDSPFRTANSNLNTDLLFGEIFGFVAQITVTINAQQGLAMTSYRLTNVRTATENAQVGFSMTSHPFFSGYFQGNYRLVEGINL